MIAVLLSHEFSKESYDWQSHAAGLCVHTSHCTAADTHTPMCMLKHSSLSIRVPSLDKTQYYKTNINQRKQKNARCKFPPSAYSIMRQKLFVPVCLLSFSSHLTLFFFLRLSFSSLSFLSFTLIATVVSSEPLPQPPFKSTHTHSLPSPPSQMHSS